MEDKVAIMWDIDSQRRVPTPPSLAVLTNSSRTISIVVGSSFATSDQISFCMVDVIYQCVSLTMQECEFSTNTSGKVRDKSASVRMQSRSRAPDRSYSTCVAFAKCDRFWIHGLM
jgi:hypothetical protein